MLTTRIWLWIKFYGCDIVWNDKSTHNFDEQHYLIPKRAKIKDVRSFLTICFVCKSTETVKKVIPINKVN